MCRSRPSHAAARPPDRESPPNRHSARSRWPYQRATDITTTRVRKAPARMVMVMHASATAQTFSATLFPTYRSYRSREGHGERLGRTLGAPYLCHPYALQIETARVLVGGTLVGCSPGRVLPSKALLHTWARQQRRAATHLVNQICIQPSQRNGLRRQRSAHLPDHLVREQIRVEADCGSAWQLVGQPVLARNSPRDPVPHESPLRIHSSPLQKVPPVSPKHCAIVGDDRRASAP